MRELTVRIRPELFDQLVEQSGARMVSRAKLVGWCLETALPLLPPVEE